MIFVTVGTQIPFDRLIKMVDEIAPELGGEKIIAQSCDGTNQPRHFSTCRFIEPARFEEIMNEARIIVAHAGTGSIISAMKRRKPLVVVARSAALGEHRNEHQKATAEYFARSSNLCVATDSATLLAAIRATPVPAELPEAPSPELINALIEFIDE